MKKINGFTLPLHPFQLISWLFTLWHIILTIIFLSTPPNSPINLFLSTIFYFSNLLVLFFGFILTKSNPALIQIQGIQFLNTDDQYAFFCSVCKHFVTKNSKHCGQCNKCIEGFDHHCKWLNNCIGKKNYKKFLMLLVSVLINLTALIGFEAFFLSDSQGVKIIVVGLDLGVNILVFLLVGYLVCFHCYLRSRGITTYEFIKQLRKRKVCSERVNETKEKIKKGFSKSQEFASELFAIKGQVCEENGSSGYLEGNNSNHSCIK